MSTPKKVRAVWVGPPRNFAEHGLVTAGDEVEVMDFEVKDNPYLEPVKPKTTKTTKRGAS